MAIAMVGTPTTAVTVTLSDGQLTINAPAAAGAGDVVIVAISTLTAASSVDPQADITPPGTLIFEDGAYDSSTPGNRLNVYSRVLTGSGESFQFTWTQQRDMVAGCVAYSGVDTADPVVEVDVAAHTTGGTTSRTTPTINTAAAGRILAFASDRSASTYTPPTNYTERVDAARASSVSIGVFESDSDLGPGNVSAVATASVNTSTHCTGILRLSPATGGGAISQAIAPAVEVDMPGQTLFYSLALGRAIEADAALAITEAAGPIILAIEPALEVDQAAEALSTTMVVEPAVEADAARPIGGVAGIVASIGVAAEINAAQPLTAVPGAVAVSVAVAHEVDAAQPVTPIPSFVGGIVPAQESDTAQITTSALSFSSAIDLAPEVDHARPIAAIGGSAQQLTIAVEIDQARTIIGDFDIPIDTTSEIDEARPIAALSVFSQQIGLATEADEAIALTLLQTARVTVGVAIETDQARTIHLVHDVGMAGEIDLARTINVVQGVLGMPLGIDPLTLTVSDGRRDLEVNDGLALIVNDGESELIVR